MRHLLAITILLLTGCSMPDPAPAQDGGRVTVRLPYRATHQRPAAVNVAQTQPIPEIVLTAPENSQTPTRANLTREVAPDGTERETFAVEVGTNQPDEARGAWAKAQAALAETKAFMNSVKWLPLLGLLPLGLLVFSLTPYGKVLALSKEGRVALIGASLFLFVAPAISKSIVDNATLLIVLTVAGVAGYVLWERKTAYKLEAAKLGAI